MTEPASPTFDEARLMANVNARAQRLFDDGYRARPLSLNRYRIQSPQGGAYVVTTAPEKCTCPIFVRNAGRFPCKHLLGLRKLLRCQRDALRRLPANTDSESRHA